jgi:hypothetical protein
MPDFTSVIGDPLIDVEAADYRLTLTPRLGLRRTGDQSPASAPRTASR